ncbi:MAG: hypothetical protein ABIZ09_10935, partial [Rhodoferax sp.]
MGVILLGVLSSQAANAQSCNDLLFSAAGGYVGGTPGNYTCVVPSGVTVYDYVVRGGRGGSAHGSPTASGAKISGSLAVTPGETLTIS